MCNHAFSDRLNRWEQREDNWWPTSETLAWSVPHWDMGTRGQRFSGWHLPWLLIPPMWGRGCLVSADNLELPGTDTCQGLWLVIVQPLIGRRSLTMITCGVLPHRTGWPGLFFTASRVLLHKPSLLVWSMFVKGRIWFPLGCPWPGWCSPGLASELQG